MRLCHGYVTIQHGKFVAQFARALHESINQMRFNTLATKNWTDEKSFEFAVFLDLRFQRSTTRRLTIHRSQKVAHFWRYADPRNGCQFILPPTKCRVGFTTGNQSKKPGKILAHQFLGSGNLNWISDLTIETIFLKSCWIATRQNFVDLTCTSWVIAYARSDRIP